MINIKDISKNLVESPHGIFTTPKHQDLEFAYADSSNWPEIERFSYWYQHRNRCFSSIVRRFPPAGPIFEIGSGNGSVALALQEAGQEVVAIEPTVNSAIMSRRRGVKNIICARFEEAGFAKGSLSNIGLFDVLEHIDDDKDFIKRLGELMPKGGYFYCAVPAWNQLWSAEDDAAGHCRRYSLKQLCRIFESTRFQVQYSSYFFAPLLLPIFFLRTIPSALGLRTLRTPELSNREHTLPKGLAGSILSTALEREVQCISHGKKKHIGASCLLVARAH